MRSQNRIAAHLVYVPLALILVLLLAAAVPVAAQGSRPVVLPLYKLTVPHPDSTLQVTMTDNEVFRFWRSGTWNFQRHPAGRFLLETLQGDPLRTDENGTIAGRELGPSQTPTQDHTDYTCFAVFSVNGQPFEISAAMDNYAPVTDPSLLPVFWRVEPIVGSRNIWGEYIIPLDVDISGGGSNLPQNATEFLTVRMTLELVWDLLKVDHVVTNNSSQNQYIGLRVVFDGRFGGAPTATTRDGREILLSTGEVLNEESSIPNAEIPVLPDSWVAFDNAVSPGFILKGVLRGGEVSDAGIATTSAGTPDALEFGLFNTAARYDQYAFSPSGGVPIVNEDWVTAVRWDEQTLSPGQSRRYVTYYGLGGSVEDLARPYVLAGYAPFNLRVWPGDDPNTPDIEDYHLTDGAGNSPFPLSAIVDNFGASTLMGVALTISLPEGLELFPLNQSRTKLIGTVVRNEAPVPAATWTARATGERTGLVEIRFTGPQGKSIRRTVGIPGLPTLNQSNLDPTLGLAMISIPYEFANSDAEHVFQSIAPLNSANATVIRWNPDLDTYAFFPEPFATNIFPGMGFWIVNRTRQKLVMPTDRQELSLNQSFDRELHKGWNQIGNPFIYSIHTRRLEVIGSDTVERTLPEAVGAGLLLPTVYWYDVTSGQYRFETDFSKSTLDPYRGYWIWCFDDLIMRFTPPPIIASGAQEPVVTAPRRVPGPNDWRVNLHVSAPGVAPRVRTLGVSAAAENGPDLADVPNPPPALPNGPTLEAAFTHSDWGRRAGNYWVDVRGSAPQAQSWDFVVSTDLSSAEVAINWPDLSEVPKRLRLRLEDVEGKRSYNMRTLTGCTFKTGPAGAQRHFRVVAGAARGGAVVVTSLTVEPAANGGAHLVYSLAQDATVDLTITNIAGRSVRRLARGVFVPAGEHSMAWDGTSSAGLRAPNGRYLVRLRARAADGTATSRVAALSLQR